MGLRMLRRGMEGPDVRAVQIGLNKVNEGDQDDLEPDGVFGGLTDSAVRRFQEDKRLDVDGIVGPSTRSALFPLVAVSVNVVGLRTQSDSAPSRLQQRIQDAFSPGRLTLGGMTPANSSGLSLTLPPLFAMPRTLSDEMVSYNGLPDMVPTPRTVASGRGRIEVDWQQIAQTQRQFTGLFRTRKTRSPSASNPCSSGTTTMATSRSPRAACSSRRSGSAAPAGTTSPSPVSPMRPG